jgi:hypothetical protein
VKDDRLRVTYQPEYAEALGLAAFCFARCEWDASYCCERLSPGYLSTIEPDKKTAGKIANELKSLVSNLTNEELKALCETAAEEFAEVVKVRNALLHGKPCTAPDGDQVLSGHDGIWTVEMIQGFADRATACQIKLNDILHQHLT